MATGKGKVKTVGIVGCGAIGTTIARYIDRTLVGKLTVAGVTDLDQARAGWLSTELRSQPKAVPLTQLIDHVQVVVEAASTSVAFHVAQQVLDAGKIVLVMSVGGLLGRVDQLRELAVQRNGYLLIPSGALCGVDAVKAMASDGLQRVTLTTTKPPMAFAGAPYVEEHAIVLEDIRDATTLYDGPAEAAVIGFPQNANVAATLTIAAGDPALVHVRLIADPHVTTNAHELVAEGSWGAARTRMESDPSETNPKTSAVAIASAQAQLQSLVTSYQVGT
jgi:aspartate dehydrogenase